MHRLLAEPSIAGFSALLGAATVKAAIEDVLREARHFATSSSSEDGGERVPSFEEVVARLQVRLGREASRTDLREVLNGTGILLHTNLGRAPLSEAALDAMREVAGGYCNLEYDLDTGTRGSRYDRVSSLLRATTGAEDGLVVNNCAAAVLLILDTFARGREVIVARNQLVEIGGGFRLPDVLERSGVRLVEVGATNKVYLRDFERALTPDTALLLRVHTSNYRIDGFVADVESAELVELGRRVGVPIVEDLGSGALIDLAAFGLPHERTVQEAIAGGVDLAAFSGDKLLGGPQAGVIVGLASHVARLRANPLLRALRVDKATLAALSATLEAYCNADKLPQIPLYQMLSYSADELLLRARKIASEIRGGWSVEAVCTEAFVGGGSLPLTRVPSAGVRVRATHDPNANGFASALSGRTPPLVVRSREHHIVVDLRTIPHLRDRDVIEALRTQLLKCV